MSLAETVPHLFTVADMRAMVRAGVIEEGARVELIEGELIEMPADGPLHNEWSSALGFWLYRALDPESCKIIPGSTLVLSERNAPKPDYYVVPIDFDFEVGGGQDVLLALEESDTTLRRDLGWKADLYARSGIRDYWAIDLKAKRLHVLRRAKAGRYTDVQDHDAEQSVEALLIPGLVLRLADLPQVGRGL